MENAIRIASDMNAMLADGELDRAAYSFDDLRLALPHGPELAALTARLEAAFAQGHTADAHDLLRRILRLLHER